MSDEHVVYESLEDDELTMSPVALGTEHSPIMEEDMDHIESQVGAAYLDTLPTTRYNIIGTQMFFITLTYPGGLTDDHMGRLHLWLTSGPPKGPSYWVGSVEGGDGITHKHCHLVIWDSGQKRTDSMSRSLRTQLFTAKDISELSSTSKLVLTRKVSDFAGACRYIYKAESPIHLGTYKLPAGIDFDDLLADCKERGAARRANGDLPGNAVFPPSGKLKSIPPSQVPDFLVKAADHLGIDPASYNTFGTLVHKCYRAGIRFDLSKLRSYRLGLEMITKDPVVSSSKVLQHEIEWRASN